MFKKWMFIALTVVLLAACASSPPSPTENVVPDIREGLPVYSGAVRNENNVASYRYTIENADIEAVQRFYKDEMQAAGWELLGAADMSGVDIGKAYALWFVKDQDILSIDIFTKENGIHAMLTLSN